MTDPRRHKARLVEALRTALQQVIGTYGIALVHADIPDFIVGARRGSPLVLGVGKDENFLASDVSAIVAYTRDAVYLNDFDLVAVERDKFEISSLAGERGNHEISKVEFTAEDIKKGDYPHYMLKEIFEQPGSVRDAMRGRLSLEECTAKLGGLNMTPARVARRRPRRSDRLRHRAACRHGRRISDRAARAHSDRSGIRERVSPSQHADDERHARLRHQPERRDRGHARRAARKPAQRLSHARHLQQRREHDRARERRRRLHARRAGDRRGGDQVVHLPGRDSHPDRTSCWAGCAIFRPRKAPPSSKRSRRLPEKIEQILKMSDQIKEIAKKYVDANGMLFFGRQFNFPIALEAALKMKEITYLYAEGHPSAELKHGIIALVRPELPSVFIAPDDAVFSKNLNNIEQVRARKGPIIAVTTASGADKLKGIADDIDHRAGRGRHRHADADRDSAATARLSPRGRARPRRRQAAQPGEERDGRVGLGLGR